MQWLFVACGGAIGASLRYGMSLWFAQPNQVFPWVTWSINLLGCLLAGIFFAYSLKYPVLQQETRLFLMVGVLGGFTTFSSFGLEAFQLIRAEQLVLALLYAVSSLIVGVLVLIIGFYITQYLLSLK
ncbi:chromosome condensation protein CrcB [Acinetobacter sp. TGL-Y2]|uniref:fluoride efflux transporter CrcB n=1 Tax=Acinetobacter sp. TGL-Y2 TaxID=1407071 RepID=UPI0007A65AD0|nr:fluoride efflux transporter CrcB [Acinetobacter sp. TGL-Y2]AMW79960.1 chromosome condensation protein CrcB [Acinetobacter sp. TGL-Y2]